jgi:hypothetical protein
VVEQGDHVVLVAIDMVGLYAAGLVTLAVSAMVEQNALVVPRKGLKISCRVPNRGIAPCSQVQQKRRTVANELVFEANGIG